MIFKARPGDHRNNSAGRDELMKQLYAPFMRKSSRILFMDPAVRGNDQVCSQYDAGDADLLMNELSAFCERCGADIEQVRRRRQRAGLAARFYLPESDTGQLLSQRCAGAD